MDRGLKRPWCVEIGELCDYNPVDIFDFFGDGGYIQSFVLIGGGGAQLKISRIIVVPARTVYWRDVTVSIPGEILELKPRWWGEV